MTVQLPFEQAHPLELSPSLRQLQHDGVIHPVRTPVGDEAWLVTGYDEVRRLLRRRTARPVAPRSRKRRPPGRVGMLGGPRGNYDTEQADHARTRSLLQPHFSAKRMRALQPRVEELATALLDDLARQGPPADLHQALALPLPIQVICELLGVPYADRGQFRSWSEDAGNVRDRARSEHGLRELFDYGRRLATRKREQPGDDVISRLCADGLSDDEVATNSMNLLFAGHETTVVAIGMGVLCLLANPAQRRGWPTIRGWSLRRLRRYFAPRAAAAAAFRVTPAPPCRSGRSPCSPATWCCWTTAPPTTTPRPFPAPRTSTSPATRHPTSRSGTAPLLHRRAARPDRTPGCLLPAAGPLPGDAAHGPARAAAAAFRRADRRPDRNARGVVEP